MSAPSDPANPSAAPEEPAPDSLAPRLVDYARLHALLSATEPMNESGEGGSHTDVFRFDANRLRLHLGRLFGSDDLGPPAEWLVQELSSRFLVKKGKIHLFSMPLLGDKQNHIRRGVVSGAFGPIGYNLMPTYDKTMLDANEAARVIPYFGCGAPSRFFAPDFLQWVDPGIGDGALPSNEEAVFVRVLGSGTVLRHTAYEILLADPYFHGRVDGPGGLADFQAFVRRNPLIPAMEEKLADFFEAPLTVGWRDTLRWLRGSRHPHMPWDTARAIVARCFERHGSENFVLPEITYYSYDSSYTPKQVAALLRRNRRAAACLSELVRDELPARARTEWLRQGDERLAFELLDFHHDYPLYEIEPYQGMLSGMMVRFLARFAEGVFLQVTGLPEPDRRNADVERIPPFHAGLVGFFGRLDGSDRERTVESLERVLGRIQQRGLRDRHGDMVTFERVPRTFYTFQGLANVPRPGWRVTALHELDELWTGDHVAIWQRYPQLAEKLVVFFTLVYRYFLETGFVPDLRPRDAGRDIFIYGIWGYVTENLLVVEEEGPGGERDARVVFVDNRDQFKQYRRVEDRRRPLGMAKHALRLAYPLIEPAMQRSIGIFALKVRDVTPRSEPAQPPGAWGAAERGLDVARTVVQSSVDGAFVNTKAVVDDVVDDVYVGAKKRLGDVAKRVEKIKPTWPPTRRR